MKLRYTQRALEDLSAILDYIRLVAPNVFMLESDLRSTSCGSNRILAQGPQIPPLDV